MAKKNYKIRLIIDEVDNTDRLYHQYNMPKVFPTFVDAMEWIAAHPAFRTRFKDDDIFDRASTQSQRKAFWSRKTEQELYITNGERYWLVANALPIDCIKYIEKEKPACQR